MSVLNGRFKTVVLYTSEEINYICSKSRNKPIIPSSCLTSMVGDSINNTIKSVFIKDTVTKTSYWVTKITINIYIKRRHSQDATNLFDYLSSVLVQRLTGSDVAAVSIFLIDECLRDICHCDAFLILNVRRMSFPFFGRKNSKTAQEILRGF